MSVAVNDKPVSMWTSMELIQALDILVCIKDQRPEIAVIAEGLSRLLTAAKNSGLIS
jgi:hypothetical protein